MALEINLSGQLVAAIGIETDISAAALEALCANGGRLIAGEQALTDADLLLVSWNLLPGSGGKSDCDDLVLAANEVSGAMRQRGKGSIVFLLSAIAAIPMRRHAEFSQLMASAVTAMRCLSMASAPGVRINALGFGCIGDAAAVAGDVSMLTHVPLGRPGRLEEAVAAVLFMADPANSYTTGQLLAVDGGWSTGYGRNF